MTLHLSLSQSSKVGEHESVIDGGRGDEDVFFNGGPLVLGEESLHQVDSKGPLPTVHDGLEEMSDNHEQTIPPLLPRHQSGPERCH